MFPRFDSQIMSDKCYTLVEAVGFHWGSWDNYLETGPHIRMMLQKYDKRTPWKQGQNEKRHPA